jgi:hypothetical protein
MQSTKLKQIKFTKINKKKSKCQMFTEEKLNESGATLDNFPQKFFRHLTQEPGLKFSGFKFALLPKGSFTILM